MPLEPDYLLVNLISLTGPTVTAPDFATLTAILILIILLSASALLSASEVAYFSLGPAEINKIKTIRNKKAEKVLRLYSKPERLLSTILVGNNLVNVAVIIISAFISRNLFHFSDSKLLEFLIQVIIITFLILLFGEIMPKVYATKNRIKVALFMAFPLAFLDKLFKPVTAVLVLSSSFVRKRTVPRPANLSMNDLSDALELTTEELTEEGKILKGIVKFGNINVNAIMCPRLDVTKIDIQSGFTAIIRVINDSGFSRIPVYSGTFDNVTGILYAKDVLPYSGNPDSFKWQSLLRPPYFVPETKKINELLKEFQQRKIHMAIVIDEYGGVSGIVTLEDILEEIVGEISDESDDDKPLYRQLDKNTYIFEGKILLNDFCRILGIEGDPFEETRGESETLAGLILELTGEIPVKNQEVQLGSFRFIVESSDKRRIKEIKLIIKDTDEHGKEV
jgi:putative hemolysin